MSLVELQMLTSAIAEIGVEVTWEKVRRREAITQLLNRFKLDLGDPPADFDGIYAYTLVEYGVFKPEPILNFFRNEFVCEAFRQSFYRNNPSILDKEAEGIIKWNEETGKLGRIDYDPRREFASFSAIFNEIVDRARTPAEVKRDRKLEQIYGDLHASTTEILKQFSQLLNLEEVRALVACLELGREARRFVLTPTGDKLKVFISSKMIELRDVRELVNHELEKHGLDAWVYEDAAGAKPGNIVETSLQQVEAADIYIGLFWEKYGQITVDEYRYARSLGKPCFVYVRDKNLEREPELSKFLETDVYDLKQGVTFDYFESALKLAEQAAQDIMTWLVRTYRELSVQAQEAIGTEVEVGKLKAEVERLRTASQKPLPHGDLTDTLARHLREWFSALNYGLARNVERVGDYADQLITVPRRRRGVDRILVRALGRKIELADLDEMLNAVEAENFDEGWLVTERRISQLARTEADQGQYEGIVVYTFDELLDEQIDWQPYFKWLEQEVKRKHVDEWYVPLSGRVDEYDSIGQKQGANRYPDIDQYIAQWLDSNEKAHISILGEFGTGKTWFCLHYAWTILQDYRQAKEQGINRPRLPLVIPLRKYVKALKVESVFADFFFNEHNIRLTSDVFEQLNRMGKLLLIFDGFDEMADRVDRQKMVNNFWELAQVVTPGAKAILTCRTEHFPNAKEGRLLLNAELQSSTANYFF